MMKATVFVATYPEQWGIGLQMQHHPPNWLLAPRAYGIRQQVKVSFYIQRFFITHANATVVFRYYCSEKEVRLDLQLTYSCA